MRKIYFLFFVLLVALTSKAQFPAPYCAASFGSGVEPITKVQFAGINNASPATTGTTALQDFLSISASVQQTGSYTITVEGNSDGPYSNYYRVYFDWNQDNDFVDPDEMYEIGSITNSTGLDGQTASASISVPLSALVGSTRMRVIKKYGTTNPLTSPCNTAGYGQAEDYTVTVTAGVPCSGTPAGGTTSASVTYLCAAGTSVLSVSGFGAGTGVSFQWQSSPAGANTFTDVVGGTGATTASYTSASLSASTDFRCKVTCANGGAFSYSTTTTVTFGGVPSNDLVCNATALVLDAASSCANTTCATATGDPTFANSTANNTIWYSYTPTATGVYNFVMTRPAGQTSGFLYGWLGVYTATGTCPSLTLTETTSNLAFDLTTLPSVTLVTPTLTAGTTYYFMIDGFSSAFGAFCIQLVTPPAPPATCATNTAPANAAIDVAAPVATLAWSTVANATAYDIYFGTTNPPTTLAGTITAATTSPISGLAFGTTYYWYVVPKNNGGSATGCTSNITSFTTVAPPPPPANDACAAATAVGIYQGTINGTTVSATASTGVPGCTPTTGEEDDVWYKFTASQNGSATIVVTGGTGFDAVVAAYSGTCGSLTLIGSCLDNTGSAGVETLSLTSLVAGQTYYLRIYSYSTTATGTFTMTLAGAALPVAIVNFKGEKIGTQNVLSWTTASEVNNAGFEIQRSADGTNFSKLAFIDTKANNGNSSQALTYSYTDIKPFTSNGYYRLKQLDKDGKLSLSEIVLIKGVKPSKLELVSVYPNPAINTINIGLVTPKADKITFVISDITGKIVISKSANVISGDSNLQLDITALAKGTYTVKAVCANGCETAISKFVKQ